MQIELIQHHERPQIAPLWEASVRATHHFLAESDIQHFCDLVETWSAKLEHVWGVRATSGAHSGAYVGFMETHEGNINMLFVHPAYFGQGIGSALTAHAIHSCGATRVDVNEQNEQAYLFYERIGFVVTSRSPVDDHSKPYPILHMELSHRPRL